MLGSLALNAQDFISNETIENGKTVSKTEYMRSSSGLYDNYRFYEYVYDESGECIQEDVYRWHQRKQQWMPDHRIIRTIDDMSDTINVDYYTWNEKTKSYGSEPKESKNYKKDNQKDKFVLLKEE